MAASSASVLSGNKLGELHASDDNAAVSITAGRTVVFSVDPSSRECTLKIEAADDPIEGDRIFEDGEGRKIVRVVEGDDRVSLHLADGTIFHVLAVVNEDGCRVATREEREHGRGASSFLDRLLALVR
jgi:hypothetical protein